MSNLSLDYYERRASTYAQQTLTVNMGTLIREFLALLPPAGHILDMGCGSGRDAVAFLQRGYDITALDGSAALCRIAKEQLNKAWRCPLCFIQIRPTFSNGWGKRIFGFR